VVNATTYDFPVLYKVLQGGTQDRIHSADPTVVDLIIEAGRELEQQGVRAIAGACGCSGLSFKPASGTDASPLAEAWTASGHHVRGCPIHNSATA
jgi:hypothetical protein